MPIELKNICKAYNEKTVLDSFSCRFEDSAVSCIMAPSGHGKTTLLRIIAGLEQSDSGEVTGVAGKRLSFVFQEDRLCENLSAASNIRLVCPKSVKTSDIIEAMDTLGLAPDKAKQTVRSMSGGERRRVVILRALMADYDILLMDEPFKELDTETKERVMLYVKEKSKGKTVLLITHDKAECELMNSPVIELT